MADAKVAQRRASGWWAHQGRSVRRAVAGYAVVVMFAAGYLLARVADSKLSPSATLIPAALVAGPLMIAFLGDRITGLKFMSVEVSLSDVRVEVNDDISAAIRDLTEMGPSAMPEIANRVVESITHPGSSPLVRVNLLDGKAWWSTRVFLLAALASDYTDIQRLVFVDRGEDRLFVGMVPPMNAHRSLARRFPNYETFYRKVRSSVSVPPFTADTADEVNGILQMWPAEFGWNEEANKEFVTRSSLSEWLANDLESETIEWDGGPLTALVRFQINSQPSQYVAMTSRGKLVGVVDRVALATRAERDVLQARLS